jgi:hypothetical protein
MGTLLSYEDGLAILAFDRRKNPRYICESPRLIYLKSKSMRRMIAASVRDYSVNGLGIIADRRFRIGSRFEIRFPMLGPGLTPALTAKVIHRADLPSGNRFLGCSLSRLLTFEEQRHLRGG